MLPRSAKAKGKRLEKYVADRLSEIDKYAYRRADSGSGRLRKEDVFTTLPLFIECKNQENIQISQWWKQTLRGTPKEKFPVLIYKKNFEKQPTVTMRFGSVLSWISGHANMPNEFNFLIHFSFEDFILLIKNLKLHE